jgi:rhodanese-related sulfurtransferase
MSEVISITPQELYELHKKGESPYLIDVRTKSEFEDLRASIITEHLPLDEFDPEALELEPSTKLYFICRSGRRSFEAASQCLAYGFEELYNVEGGTLEWESQELPLVSGAQKKKR